VPEGLTARPRGLLYGSPLLRRWYAARRKPVDEFPRSTRIGAPRVRIPDLRREEFKEAPDEAYFTALRSIPVAA
jgi:hypothetical protein